MTSSPPETEGLPNRVVRATRGDIDIVTVRGAIDMATADTFRRTLVEATSRTEPKVVVVCEDVHFINSTGIGALYSCHCNCRKARGGMVLCRPTPKLQELVSMIGLRQVFVQADSEDDALAILEANGQQSQMH